VEIGLAILFFAAKQCGPSRHTRKYQHRCALAGGVIGFAEADFAWLAFSALLFSALAVGIRTQFLDGDTPAKIIADCCSACPTCCEV
jgi:hypothetical protein